MEEGRKGKRKSLAYASRSSRVLRNLTLDDYGDGRSSSGEKGDPTQDYVPNASRIGASAIHREFSGGTGPLLESDASRCRLILGFKEGYPCFFCRGGLDYTECLRIKRL